MSLSTFRRQLVQSLPALVLAVGVGGLLAFELLRSYQAARTDAEHAVQNLVRVLSEQTARTFQSIELNLSSIAEDLSTNPNLADNDADFRGRLRERLHDLPYVRAFYVIGADGFISHDTDYPSTPHVSLADRPYFQFHQQNITSAPHIGLPLRSRSVGAWFISLSRRITARDGTFAGIVVAAVEPLYFEDFYRELWVGGGTIALFLRNGILLARSPQNDDAIGRSFSWAEPFRALLAGHARGVSWSISPIDSVRRLAGYQAVGSEPLVMMVTMNRDDVMRPWWMHATAMIVGAAILLALLATLEWLSRRFRRREEQARTRLERAQRLEAVGRLAAGIAHDFGNVLRIVRSTFLLLQPMVADRVDASTLLKQADQSVAAGRTLIDQLLSFSGDRELRPEPSDLNDLISSGLPIFRPAAGARIDIAVNLSSSPAICMIDRAQFQAAIVNLILNARDAMPSGGTVVIGVRVIKAESDAARFVEITIRDGGTGVSADIVDRVFDPFFSTKKPWAGHGLGLSQVYGFVERSHGQIELSSEEGRGTTITLRFAAQNKVDTHTIVPPLSNDGLAVGD
jgi:signal transduction histidine kinase